MLQIQCLNSKRLELNALFSRFVIGPLKKGQGLTIGNTLRRTLLSDLQSIAIAGVRIPSVNHEFSSIDGIKEDIVDILLNFKQIALKGSFQESELITRLTYQGPGIITAKSIELPEEITLVEPNQYIAMVTSDRLIEMEVLIKKGEGYSARVISNQLPDQFLAVDTIYIPVKRVNFFIETGNSDNNQNSESLILEIYTNGSITPTDAISKAAENLLTFFAALKITDSSTYSPLITSQKVKKESLNNISSLDNILIEELELSVRAFNCLKRASIHTLADLLKYSQEDLLEFKNFGQKSADEVCSSLETKFGKSLR